MLAAQCGALVMVRCTRVTMSSYVAQGRPVYPLALQVRACTASKARRVCLLINQTRSAQRCKRKCMPLATAKATEMHVKCGIDCL